MDANWIGHVRDVLGQDATGLSDREILETYVPVGTKFLDRSVANNRKEAAESLSAWTRGSKGRKAEDIYRVKVEPVADDIGVLVLGNQTLRGTANLAINEKVGSDRRMAAERVLDLYLQARPDLIEADVIEAAKDRYARINQILGKETHHMLEVDGTDELIQAMPPEERLGAAQRLINNGFALGDAAPNQIALYGASNPGPAGSVSTKAYPEQNEHQSVVHSETGFKAIADQYGFPSLRNSVDKGVDTSVPRWAKTEAIRGMVRDLRALAASGARTPADYMKRQDSPEKRLAVIDQYGDLSRLSVQEAKNIGLMPDGNTDKNNSAIRRSLDNLDKSYRELAGDDVADYERGVLANLGIDLDDELLRNRRSGRVR